MTNQDKQKLHQSTIAELRQQLNQLNHDLVNKRQEVKLGRSKNTKATHNLRNQIVVIKTILQEKQLNQPSKE